MRIGRRGFPFFLVGLSRGAVVNNGDGVRMKTKEVESSGKGIGQISFWMGQRMGDVLNKENVEFDIAGHL